MSTSVTLQNSVFDLVAQAGLVAKLVLLILLAASVLCWTVIFAKWRSMRQAIWENERFLAVFWNGKSMDEILGKSDKFPRSPVAKVFKAGVKELRKLSEKDAKAAGADGIDNISRALSRTSTNELSSMENHVSWLATTASAAPFVGLFGTVWGIMNSFQNIGATGAANLAVVAPGISEALITTAAGIFAAIPAVIAYNHIVGQIKRLAIEMDSFSNDFLNIVQRSLFGDKR